MSFLLENVCFEVDNKKILKNINLNISSSGITCIIGPSGSGKTSLLKLLNMLTQYTSGKLKFKDKSIETYNPRKIRKIVGYVPQQSLLFEKTVRDNLEFGPKIWRERIEEKDLINLLKKVRLPIDYLNKDVKKLSGGEQQRVSIARTLANNPEVLLMDEPTSDLDISTKEYVEQLIKEFGENKKVIFISHDIDQIARISNDVIFIRDGMIVEHTPTKEFMLKYSMSELRLEFER